ncbi:MAG: DUF1570 domain-containing protein [Planctomycetales bacterium]|nr:DUF1570 domain-containing protein [Planctomycetales bacterium]
MKRHAKGRLPRGARRASLASLLIVGAVICIASARGDIVLYQVPATRLVFMLEGRTTVNPGKTVTLRHALGTVYLGLDDVKIFKVDPPNSLASSKLNAATASGDVKQCLAVAKWALHNGLLPKFYEARSAAWKVDSTNPTVRRLAALRQKMAAPLPPPAREKTELEAFAQGHSGMQFAYSKHFILMHDTTGAREGAPRGKSRAEERLDLLETVYESFLMKFALEGYELQVPREYLKVILFARHEDYLRFCNLLGPELQSTAGFYQRDKNISVFYVQGTHESFEALDTLSKALQRERDEAVRNRTPGARELVRLVDTLQLLMMLSSINQDVEVVSHEATHHMAGVTGLMPGSAPVPTWAAEGLATYFESPKEAAWSGIGAVNEDRLDWYKQLERDPIHSSIEFVVTDRIFTQARATEGQLHGYGQAWALTHFLMERHFDKLMNWYILVGQRRQRERLTPEQLLSSFRFVFGDLRLLEQEWRLYMRGLQTDVERVLKGN